MDLTITLLDRLTLEVQGNSYDGVDFNKLFVGIDFSSDDIATQSYKNIARIINSATKNETIDKTDMLVAFCLLTKQTLVSNGLGDVKISYIHKTDEEIIENATTYYSDKDKTINLFFEDILDEVMLKKLNAPIAPLARVVEIVKQINIMKQVVQTAQQFELFRVFSKTPNLTPPSVYISQKQYLATTLSKKKGKYLSYDLLTKTANGKELNYGDFSKYGATTFDVNSESDSEWSYLTNPKQALVSTSYMASLVLCDVLRKLTKEDRDVFAKEYPVVFLNFNTDGTRKTLIEVEKDRENKLKNIQNIKDKKQQELETKAVLSLYEAIIESDPILSLERCLLHITNLSWESDRYFVPKNEENEYSPTSIREEMRLASEKAQAIISVIEGDGAEFVEPILKTFEKTILDFTKAKKVDKTFLDDKKHYMFAISNLYFKNDDLSLGPKDKVLASDDKRKEIDRAVKTLKIVFPTLLPNPTVFGVSGDGKYIELPNVDERIMLDIAWENYRTAYITKKDEDPDLLGVEPIDLQRAIRLVYPYNEYSFEDRVAVEEKIKEGEITLIPNLYEVVTEEDFYGDEIEDEEIIVDTDDEMDYNRFFVVKEDKNKPKEDEEKPVEDVTEKTIEEQETVSSEEATEEATEEVAEEIVETEKETVSEEDKKDDNRTQEKSQEEIEKQNKSIEKLTETALKVVDKKTQNAISSIEEVVAKKEKEKQESKNAAKVKPQKEGKNVAEQFAEFEKVLGDVEEVKQEPKIEELKDTTEVKEEKAEEVKETASITEEKTEEDSDKVEKTEDAVDKKETETDEKVEVKTENLAQDAEKEEANKDSAVTEQIDNLIEEVDDLIEQTEKPDNDDDETDLGKTMETVEEKTAEETENKEEPKTEVEENAEVVEEKQDPKTQEETKAESPVENAEDDSQEKAQGEEGDKKEEKANKKPKVNITKEQLEEGDKLTGEELLEKYFKFKEKQEQEEAEKERLRAEAAARGEPYGEDEEVKIPVEPTKEDVYASAIEIEDVTIKEKKDDEGGEE